MILNRSLSQWKREKWEKHNNKKSKNGAVNEKDKSVYYFLGLSSDPSEDFKERNTAIYLEYYGRLLHQLWNKIWK